MKKFPGDMTMTPEMRYPRAKRQRGQTIIVAMIILGLLLILGFVFLGIINRSIRTSGLFRDRSIATDLSEAGIRYAQEQLLRSAEGADWRGQPTPPVDWIPGPAIETTRDPDALYLRPPGTVGGQPAVWPGGGFADRGGPDGLGPFFRVPFRGGRALVRVRYAPSDADIFRSSPAGILRRPGALRNYILIESVGREGVVDPKDPTMLLNTTPRRIGNYANQGGFVSELGLMRADQTKLGGLQVNRAFASIGIIESARFITNKDRVSRPASLGVPQDIGAVYREGAVADLPIQIGTAMPLLQFNSNSATSTNSVPVGGSLFSNADIELHGRIVANLNLTLGDEIDVAGNISGDDNARLVLQTAQWNGATWPNTPATVTLDANTFNSASPTFAGSGYVRDGSEDRDLTGMPRGVGRKAPPSAFGSDPETRTNRYLEMTRGSGYINGGIDTGAFGYGQGIYVNNFSDRQEPQDEIGRANTGGESSLINDWLNPSNPRTKGWNGYLYIPPGAYVQFQYDGFVITRDGRNVQEEHTWRNPDATDSGLTSMRFRLGRGTDGRLHIVNPKVVGNIDGALGVADYQNGPVFNGVLYFEGNARVRGVIPTDVQVTLVSGATIYIEGSITKGVVGNNFTATYNTARDSMSATSEGLRLNRPSKSMLMLIARDYVAVNTTQFFGAAPSQAVEAKGDVANLPSLNPLLVRASTDLRLRSEFVLDPETPGGTTYNPNTWRSYAGHYAKTIGGTDTIPTNLLMFQAMDDGTADLSFLGMTVNAGIGNSTYMFPVGPNPPYANGATEYMTGTMLPLYGLGTENYQRYGKFEGITFPLVDPANMNENATRILSTGTQGAYNLSTVGPNDISLRPQSFAGVSINDYVLGRLAIAPHDIRIEASMFAENGSFFVIPGPWFNPNPNDSYLNWLNNGTTDDERNNWRLENFGSTPNIPFYGEPLDVRIVISGAVSENMPPTASQQAEWIRKWGWIPKRQGAAFGTSTDYVNNITIPYQHRSTDPALTTATYVPNIIMTYDPVLATGRRYGFYDPTAMNSANLNDPGTYVRSKWIDYNMDGLQQISELVPLPPLPRLPVSPALAYFGEVH